MCDSVVAMLVSFARCELATPAQRERARFLAIELGGFPALYAITMDLG